MDKLKSRPVTRKMVKCPVFGSPEELTDTSTVLPTYKGVMKYYLWLKHDLKPNNVDAVAVLS